MTGQLITLPVRIGLYGARLAIRVAEDLTGRAVTTTLRVAEAMPGVRGPLSPNMARPSSDAAERFDSEQRESPSPSRNGHESTANGTNANGTVDASAVRDPRSEMAVAEPETRAPAAPEPEVEQPLASERLEQEGFTAEVDFYAVSNEPAHVSEEAVLVREEAEPGAQDGAGAMITIQEPWQGYAATNAKAIINRLNGASAAELAAVQLYESSHRSRQTVLQAVERELKAAQRGR